MIKKKKFFYIDFIEILKKYLIKNDTFLIKMFIVLNRHLILYISLLIIFILDNKQDKSDQQDDQESNSKQKDKNQQKSTTSKMSIVLQPTIKQTASVFVKEIFF